MNLLTMGFLNPKLAGNVLSIPPAVLSVTDKNYDGPLTIDAKCVGTPAANMPLAQPDPDQTNFLFSKAKKISGPPRNLVRFSDHLIGPAPSRVKSVLKKPPIVTVFSVKYADGTTQVI